MLLHQIHKGNSFKASKDTSLEVKSKHGLCSLIYLTLLYHVRSSVSMNEKWKDISSSSSSYQISSHMAC